MIILGFPTTINSKIARKKTHTHTHKKKNNDVSSTTNKKVEEEKEIKDQTYIKTTNKKWLID